MLPSIRRQFPPFHVWFLCLATMSRLVTGEIVHIVNVGWDGSFFSPATVSALLNDTVRFVFSGNYHTVTQSTFFSPCSPLKGGFDSGPVKQTADGQSPSWDLKITNVSQPIWYFCAITAPVSHCSAGMVGVINPPSIQNFNDFVDAAKAVSGTPQPSPTLHLSGIGAAASASPSITASASAAPSSSSFFTTPSTTISSSSFSPSATAEASSGTVSSKKKGAMIGGIIGGIVIAALLIFLIVAYLQRRKKEAKIHEFFRYHIPRGGDKSSAGTKGFNSDKMTAPRRVIPPPVQPHFTTPAPPPVRVPRRKSWDQDQHQDLADTNSNRGSVPTYSSKASDSGSLTKNIGLQPLAPPKPHPYTMALGNAEKSLTELTPGLKPVHSNNGHSNHGHSNHGHEPTPGHAPMLSNASATTFGGKRDAPPGYQQAQDSF